MLSGNMKYLIENAGKQRLKQDKNNVSIQSCINIHLGDSVIKMDIVLRDRHDNPCSNLDEVVCISQSANT